MGKLGGGQSPDGGQGALEEPFGGLGGEAMAGDAPVCQVAEEHLVSPEDQGLQEGFFMAPGVGQEVLA